MSTSIRKDNRRAGDSERHGVRLMVPAVVAAAATAIAVYGGLISASKLANSLYDAAVSDSDGVAEANGSDSWVRPDAIWVEPPEIERPMGLDQILIRPAPLPEPPRLAPPELHPRSGLEVVFVPERPAAVRVRPPETPDVEFDESLAPSDLERPRAPALPPIRSGRDN